MQSSRVGERRISQRRMVDSIEGRLLARSMVFKTVEPTVLLQFRNARSVDIFVELDSGTLTELQIGRSYRLTRLEVRVHKILGAQERVLKMFVLRVTSHTSCVLIEDELSQSDSSNLSNYEGTVTDMMKPLFLYQLDGNKWLCLAYMWGRVQLPALGIGAKVKLYNVHCIDDCFVLCERGSLSVTQQAEKMDDSLDVRPLQWLVENWQLSFKDVLWLQRQYHVMERKFCRLLSAVLREDKAVSIDVLLVNLVKCMEKSRETVDTLVLRDVFFDHDKYCCVEREGTLRGDVITLAQLTENITVPLDCEDWKHRRVQYRSGAGVVPLVCRLTTDCGHFSAGDDTGSLPLLLTSDMQDSLSSVVGFVIIIPVYVCIFEVFQADVPSKYLQAQLGDVQVALDVRKSLPVVGALCPDCNHIRTCQHICPSLHSLTMCFHLLHKTSPIREGAKSNSYCHLIGRLDDPVNKVLQSSPSMVVLTVINEMVPLEQVMCVGGTYQLQLSSSELSVDQSSYPRRHYAMDGSSSDIKRAFKLPPDVSLRLLSLEMPRYPRVEEAMLWRPDDEQHMHAITGVVVTRRHQPPTESKKGTVGVQGFGIPGSLVMILTLRDDNGCQNNEMTVYANNWKQLRYPLGMLPGATITCSYLSKKMSASGRAYFFNNKLTHISFENFRHSL